MTDLSPERVAELERRALKRATALRDAAQGAVGERRACLETDADLLDALANALPALLAERETLRKTAGEARDALAGIVVMLGTGQGDPMGTARKHFLALDAALAEGAPDG